MKRYTRRIARPPRHLRVPAFLPVPLRTRADGWTPLRQAEFLGRLAETGSVEAAARRVGMARETAYRLRRKPGAESFAAAWDAVTGRARGGKRKVTSEELSQHALGGLLKPMIWRGEYAGTAQKWDNSALLAHLRQLDRSAVGGAAPDGRSQGLTSAVVSSR